jgi:VanZ family protein
MRRHSSIIWALLATAWALFAWWLLTFEQLPTPPPAADWFPAVLLQWDKAGHAGLFLVQALLFALAAERRFGLRRALLFAVAFCLAFGAISELRQRTIPTRDADPADVAADGAGALAAAAALPLSRRWSRARARVRPAPAP